MLKQWLAQIFYQLTWLIVRPIFKFFTNFQVSFLPDLFLEKPIILVSNHLSFLDPFLIGLSLPLSSKIHPLRFFAYDKFMNSPLGFFLKVWGSVPTYSGQGLDISLRLPRQIIKEGGAILIFPQGRRDKNFNIHRGKVGAAVLSLTTDTSILPLAISDSDPGNLLKFLLRKRKIKISIGRPFSLAEKLNKKENYTRADFNQATEIIMKEISRLF